MALDPQLEEYFSRSRRQNAAAGGTSPPPAPPARLDPQLEAYFQNSRAQNQRAQPPPVVTVQPASPPAAPAPAPQPVAAAAPPKEQGFSWWKLLSWMSDPFTATLNKMGEAGYQAEAEGRNPVTATAGAVSSRNEPP